MNRCSWCLGDELYMKYHDLEWGKPVYDDQTHFEFMVLESAQAGLSWITILRKRENYRLEYEGFDPEIVRLFDEDKIEKMLLNPGIVRNRKKIEASIGNASVFLQIVKEFGSFADYIFTFTGGGPIINHWNSWKEAPATSPISDAISKDLKKRGCKFLGSTIVYSHLQATGMIMDHEITCHRYPELSNSK